MRDAQYIDAAKANRMIEHWDDLEVVCILNADDYTCDFKVYTAILQSQGGYFYIGADGAGSTSSTDLVFASKFDPIFYGHVKWDGCMDMSEGSSEANVMFHFCGRAGVEKFGQALLRIHDQARRLIPNASK